MNAGDGEAAPLLSLGPSEPVPTITAADLARRGGGAPAIITSKRTPRTSREPKPRAALPFLAG